MTDLAHTLDRTILIRAQRRTVFRYFTDSERWARWWGAGSTIDPRPAGEVLIRHPNNVLVRGEVVEVVADERIVFTYGYESGEPIPVGASRVTVRLGDDPQGTRVSLHHALPDAAFRDAHIPGWRYQLAVFANVVADEAHAAVDERIDRWFAAWSEREAEERSVLLGSAVTDDVAFRDRFGCVAGREELAAHIGAVHTFMPGTRIERVGDARHCQGVALVDWRTDAEHDAHSGQGTSVFTLSPDGRIREAVGVWSG